MDRPSERKTVVRTRNNAEGHDVVWEVSVRDLLLLKSWHYVKNYRTFCGTTPSAFRFEMFLPEVGEDDTASLSVNLERVDSGVVELEAAVWVDFCDTNENLIFPKQTFSKAGMLRGMAIRETVEMRCLPNMRAAIHRNARVFITVMISFCHSDSE